MPNHAPLTRAEKERIWQAKLQGQTLPEIAALLNCSVATIRKWWRVARDHGRRGLTAARAPRPVLGPLARTAPAVVATVRDLKARHPHWGPARIRVALAADPLLAGLHLPSHSRLAAFLATHFPPPPRPLAPPQAAPPAPPQAAHEVWQLDMQEGVRLAHHRWAIICTIRDVFSGAIIISRAFDTTRGRHWRKLTVAEIRAVIRAGMAEWHTRPQVLQTDNELRLGGTPSDPFPSQITLWLTGIGVEHRLIHPGRPTEQAQIERTHRTLQAWVAPTEELSVEELEARLEENRLVYNRDYPAQASGCGGLPPLTAYPSLRWARRPYQPEQEIAEFDWARVYAALAAVRLDRRVSTTGRVSVGRQGYQLGRAYAGQQVQVQCDAQARAWVFYDEGGQEVQRYAVKGLTEATLLGVPTNCRVGGEPWQLPLPDLAA